MEMLILEHGRLVDQICQLIPVNSVYRNASFTLKTTLTQVFPEIKDKSTVQIDNLDYQKGFIILLHYISL